MGSMFLILSLVLSTMGAILGLYSLNYYAKKEKKNKE